MNSSGLLGVAEVANMTSAQPTYASTSEILAGVGGGIIGIAPDEGLVRAWIAAWATLPVGGFWVGGYDGGAYVWLRAPCPDRFGLCQGEAVGLQHRYRGRFVLYSEHPIIPLQPAMLNAVDPLSGITFRASDAIWRLLPLDADIGFWQVSPDRHGERVVQAESCRTAGAVRLLEGLRVVCAIVSRQDGDGVVAEIRAPTGELIEPADEYVPLRATSVTTPAELLIWHRGLRLLIARDGRMFQAD